MADQLTKKNGNKRRGGTDEGDIHIWEAQIILDNPQSTVTKLEAALVHLTRAIYLNPIKPQPYSLRALAYLSMGDIKSAITDLRHALQLEPDDKKTSEHLAILLDYRGTQWLELAQYRQAISHFREAIRLIPKFWPFKLHLTLAYVCSGEMGEALKEIENCIYEIEHASEKERDRELAAVLAFDGKELRKATLPKIEVYILRGKIWWAMGSISLAVKDFRQCEVLDPRHPEVTGFIHGLRDKATELYRHALKEVSQGHHQPAVEKLNIALEIVPDDMKIRLVRSAAYRRMAQYEEALNDLRIASFAYWEAMMGYAYQPRDLLHPPYQETPFYEPLPIVRQRNLVLNEIAVDLVMQKKYEDGITLLNKIIEEERDLFGREPCRTEDNQQQQDEQQQQEVPLPKEADYRFFVNRGDCHRALDHIELALADYHQALKLKPKDWQITTRLSLIHYTMGTKFFNEGQWQEAEGSLTQAITLNEEVAAYHVQRGKVRYYRGAFGQAFKDYRQAVELDPQNEEALRLLSQINQKSPKKRLPSLQQGVFNIC